jgi:hypothetical protein
MEAAPIVASVADWICNVMLWGAIVAFAALLYTAFVSPEFLANAVNALTGFLGAGVVAVLAAYWPRL